MRSSHLRRLTVLALIAITAVACGGSSGPATTRRTPPDLAAFLRLPVATPSDCPRSTGSASGRRSPWVGHVDVSVFVADGTNATVRRQLYDALTAESHVAHVYTETKQQAWGEFQRLYTCSAQVPHNAVRASYRIVLDSGTTTPQRDALVRAIYRLSGVGDVSCDPFSPCTNIRPSH